MKFSSLKNKDCCEKIKIKRFYTEHQTQLKLRDVPALFSKNENTQRGKKKTGRRKQRRYKYNCIITTTTIEKKT